MNINYKNMKKKLEKRAKGEKYQSLKSKIVILLQKRNDVKRMMLPDLTGSSQICVDMALTSLRKSDFKIFPIHGAGTPLRIASGQTDAAKYINWRRAKFLPTVRRMIITEHTIGEKYPELDSRPKELLQIMNESTSDGI